MPKEIRNVFISHIHEDDEGLSKLRDLLGKSGFEIRDASVTSDKPNEASNPNYIKSEILAPRIRWASTLMVYITPDTHNSDWVNWEIEYAQKMGKRIVGVWAHGATESNLPRALDDYADAVVGWNTQTDRVLISNDFVYWGGEGPAIPATIATLCKRGPGHRCDFSIAFIGEVTKWLRGSGQWGYAGAPLDWSPTS